MLQPLKGAPTTHTSHLAEELVHNMCNVFLCMRVCVCVYMHSTGHKAEATCSRKMFTQSPGHVCLYSLDWLYFQFCGEPTHLYTYYNQHKKKY